MLLSLLLQAAVAAAAPVNQAFLPKIGLELLVIVASNIGFIWAVVAWKTKRSEDAAASKVKEKDEADAKLEEKHKKLAMEVANQHNTILEAQRQFDKCKMESDAKHERIRLQVTALEPLPGKVASLEAKFEVIGVQMASMKEDVREIKADIKSNSTELRGEIRTLIALVQNNQGSH